MDVSAHEHAPELHGIHRRGSLGQLVPVDTRDKRRPHRCTARTGQLIDCAPVRPRFDERNGRGGNGLGLGRRLRYRMRERWHDRLRVIQCRDRDGSIRAIARVERDSSSVR